MNEVKIENLVESTAIDNMTIDLSSLKMN